MFELWKQAQKIASSVQVPESSRTSIDSMSTLSPRQAPHTSSSLAIKSTGSESVLTSCVDDSDSSRCDTPVRPTKKRRIVQSNHAVIAGGNESYASAEEHKILDRAGLQNLITVVENRDVQTSLVVDVAKRSVMAQRRRSSDTPSQFILLVVHSEAAINHFLKALTATRENPLAVGSYGSSNYRNGSLQWSILSKNDVIIITFDALWKSLDEKLIATNHMSLMVFSDTQRVDWIDLATMCMSSRTSPHFVSTSKFFAVVTGPANLTRLQMVLQAETLYLCESRKPITIIDGLDYPMELVMLYDRADSVTTSLSNQLCQADTAGVIPSRLYKVAHDVFVELGSCGADMFWSHALHDIWKTPLTSGDATANMAKSAIREVMRSWSFQRPCTDDSSTKHNVSPKFTKLVEVLKTCKYGEDFRGLVIVRRRVVANLIVQLLSDLPGHELGFVRPLVVTGPEVCNELQHQLFHDFSSGAYNLLVITKTADVLDIPRSSVVIHYNLFDSQLSYAFSLARCVDSQSRVVHMLERGNDLHRRILNEVTNLDDDLQYWISTMFRSTESAMPPASLHDTLDPYYSDSDDEDELAQYIQDPTTSGRLRKSDAAAVIYRLAASLQEGKYSPRSLFGFHKVDEVDAEPKFQCTVFFPEACPVPAINGPLSSSVSEARWTACYQACSQLFAKGVLDCRLFPQPPRTGLDMSLNVLPVASNPANGDVTAAVASAGTHRYPRKRPDFWSNTRSVPEKLIYPTIVLPGHLRDEPYVPVLILTKLPLPDLFSFSVFSSGFASTVQLRRGAAFYVDQDHLDTLHAYTTRVCRAVTNKPFSCDVGSMPYLIAPLSSTWKDTSESHSQRWEHPTVDSHIPWDLVRLAADRPVAPLLPGEHMPIESCVEDSIVQDRWVEFTNRFFITEVRHDLTPLSRVDDSPREAGYDNLIEYCRARRKSFEGLKNYNQPIIQVSPAPAIVNNLNPTCKPSVSPPTQAPVKYLIPELCAKLTIPASTFRTLLLLPSITRRIDDQLLVKELNAKFFHHSILERLLIAALTPSVAGVEYDYERLELLGDAYLKYVASIYCFVIEPTKREGALHVIRQQIISNKALLSGANRVGLPPYIQSKPFVAKLWLPVVSEPTSVDSQTTSKIYSIDGQNCDNGTGGTGQTPTGQGQASQAQKKRRGKRQRQGDEQNIQWLGDKTVADVVEAIIGAAYLSGGLHVAFDVTKILGVDIPKVAHWSDFARKAMIPAPSIKTSWPAKFLAAVEAILGYHLAEPQLLVQAVTHRSIEGHEFTGYDRLEFIGDAILDFFVVRHAFDRYPHLSPGGITLIKQAMVSNSALAALCVSCGLHEHIQHVAPELRNSIQAYMGKVNALQKHEYALAERERRPPGQYWLEVDHPKVLSDIVESIIGALYVSEGFSETGVAKFFDNVIKPFYDRHIRLQTLSGHPNTTLFAIFDASRCHQHQLVKEAEGVRGVRCDVVVHDIILASAMDATASSAMRRASLSALDALDGDPDFMTRTCDCRTLQHSKKHKNQKAKLGYEDDADASNGVGGLQQ
ncbi:hypothetical protein AcV5_000626 [Taiwanofungus camphoratus]|nr:hypothetical protein AcV5_000626 [Antrodia cinnamomea]